MAMRTFSSHAAVFALVPSLVLAQGIPETDNILTAWYQALESADVEALENLMAPENVTPFHYDIKDLNISQNRQEFIDSMAEWVGVIDGGTIEYKIIDGDKAGYKALVCYHFSDSEFLSEENVSIEDDKITGFSQTAKSQDCSDVFDR